MQITEMREEGLKKELNVVVDSSEMEAKISDRLIEVGKQVKLPGFRPGKVPMNLLKKRFGSSVRGEVLESTLQETTEKIISEKGFEPAIQPKIDLKSFEDGGNLEFSIEVQVLPEIELTDLSQFKPEKLVSKADDKKVKEALEKMAENNKKSVPSPKKKKAKKGDVVVIDFLGKVDGEEFEGGKAEDFRLELGSGRFIPGFEDQVIGMSINTQSDIEVNFPEEYQKKEIAGKMAVFSVNLKSIETLQTPKIDADFAKSMGFEKLSELKKAVKDQVDKDYEYLARMKIKRELLDFLSENHSFEVPSQMVDSEFEAIFKNIDQAKESNSLSDEEAKMTEEQLKTHYKAIAERRIRLGLILSDVGKKNSLTVPPEELSQGIAKEASRFPGQEQAVMEYYQNNPQAIEQLKAPLLEDKVIDFLLELALVKEKKVSPDELLKITGAVETDGPAPSAG